MLLGLGLRVFPGDGSATLAKDYIAFLKGLFFWFALCCRSLLLQSVHHVVYAEFSFVGCEREVCRPVISWTYGL
jgi:hypothetical protein